VIELKWLKDFTKMTYCSGKPKFNLWEKQFLARLYLPYDRTSDY